MEGKERRQHSRIQVSVSVRVAGAGWTANGELKDVGLGGAGILLKQANGKTGESVELFLPQSEISGQSIEAKIVRAKKTDEGYFLGLQFAEVDKDLYEALLKLSDLLIDASGPGSRKYTRVARRIPIQYGTTGDLKALIENISMGGLNMVVESPPARGETLEIVIPHPQTEKSLPFRARVVFVNPLPAAQKGLSQVGLEFDELSQGEKKRLRQLLKTIVRMDKAGS